MNGFVRARKVKVFTTCKKVSRVQMVLLPSSTWNKLSYIKLHKAGGDLSLANTFDYGERDKDGKTMEEKFRPSQTVLYQMLYQKYFTPLMAATCSELRLPGIYFTEYK